MDKRFCFCLKRNYYAAQNLTYMKKILTILCAVVAICQTASSQITITSASGFNPGDHYTIQGCDPEQVEISDTGNIDVNFSNVVNAGSALTVNFVNPTTTPYTSAFPNATAASATVSTQGVSAYAYYTNSATQFNVIGVGTPQYILSYSNPALQIQFPTHYRDSIYDEQAASYTVNGVLVKRFGITTQVADAYGNLTTPDGTFPYLRISAYQELVDSMFMDNEFFGISYTEGYTYNYMNSDYKAPLFSYSEIYTSQGDSYSAYYSINPNTGLKEQSLLISNESIYPNPTSQEEITVAFELNQHETVSFQIVDINGKVVKTVASRELTKGNHQMQMGIAELPSGFYAVLIGSDQSGTKAVKFVVE